ncbi:MAG: cupredoxin family copper-binding protein [Coriobacteriia bacterium]
MLRAIGAIAGVILLAIVLLLVFGCSSGSPGSSPSDGGGSSAGPGEVTIVDFAFDPVSIEIEKGESVTWTNEDAEPHTVSGDGGIDSSELGQGESYTKTFDSAGTFNYHCSLHPSMTGQVVVK